MAEGEPGDNEGVKQPPIGETFAFRRDADGNLIPVVYVVNAASTPDPTPTPSGSPMIILLAAFKTTAPEAPSFAMANERSGIPETFVGDLTKYPIGPCTLNRVRLNIIQTIPANYGLSVTAMKNGEAIAGGGDFYSAGDSGIKTITFTDPVEFTETDYFDLVLTVSAPESGDEVRFVLSAVVS